MCMTLDAIVAWIPLIDIVLFTTVGVRAGTVRPVGEGPLDEK